MKPAAKRGRPPGPKPQPALTVVPANSEVKPMKWGKEKVEAYLIETYGTLDPDFRRNVKPPVMQRVQSQ